MPKYKVTINLNSLNYEVDEENEDSAIKLAEQMALDEPQYDLLKWANYDVEEITDCLKECDVCEAKEGEPHCDCGNCDCGKGGEL